MLHRPGVNFLSHVIKRNAETAPRPALFQHEVQTAHLQQAVRKPGLFRVVSVKHVRGVEEARRKLARLRLYLPALRRRVSHHINRLTRTRSTSKEHFQGLRAVYPYGTAPAARVQ